MSWWNMFYSRSVYHLKKYTVSKKTSTVIWGRLYFTIFEANISPLFCITRATLSAYSLLSNCCFMCTSSSRDHTLTASNCHAVFKFVRTEISPKPPVSPPDFNFGRDFKVHQFLDSTENSREPGRRGWGDVTILDDPVDSIRSSSVISRAIIEQATPCYLF